MLRESYARNYHIEPYFVFFHSEWCVNMHRDTYASYVGHHNLMEFFGIAENESKARVKFNFLQVSNCICMSIHC